MITVMMKLVMVMMDDGADAGVGGDGHTSGGGEDGGDGCVGGDDMCEQMVIDDDANSGSQAGDDDGDACVGDGDGNGDDGADEGCGDTDCDDGDGDNVRFCQNTKVNQLEQQPNQVKVSHIFVCYGLMRLLAGRGCFK